MVTAIATFNINKNENNFPARIDALSKVIDKYNIDILCLQEDFHSDKVSSSDILNQQLNYYKMTIKTREKYRDGIKSSSNLTILSKYKPIDSFDIYFNEIKDEQRAALVAIFEIDNTKFIVVNTHLCHIESQNRTYQINGILNFLNSLDIEYKIICGDLNSTPKSTQLKLLKDNGFEFNNNHITASRGKIIDYILCSNNINLCESRVVLKEYSDHYCLINDVIIK